VGLDARRRKVDSGGPRLGGKRKPLTTNAKLMSPCAQACTPFPWRWLIIGTDYRDFAKSERPSSALCFRAAIRDAAPPFWGGSNCEKCDTNQVGGGRKGSSITTCKDSRFSPRFMPLRTIQPPHLSPSRAPSFCHHDTASNQENVERSWGKKD